MCALKTICLTALLLIFAVFANASEVEIVSTANELMATSGPGQADGLTVLIKDGDYQIHRRIIIDGNGVTYKSISNNPSKVILRGNGHSGAVKNVFSIQSNRVYLQGLSLGEVTWHAIQIHGENNADHIFLQNLVLFDTGQQMIKGSFDRKKPDDHTDFGLIENCRFEFTQGFAFQSYTGGIDIHRGENWVVKNNRFLNIRTKGKGLTEGAVHFWNSSRNARIIDNTIENCDRGILLGLDNSSHTTALVQGNRIHTVKDTGIYLCNATDIQVFDNSIFIDSSYPNAIEYRFPGSRNIIIKNNRLNAAISSRNGGQAQVTGNDISPLNLFKSSNLTLPRNAQKFQESTTPNPIHTNLSLNGHIIGKNAAPKSIGVTGISVFHSHGQSFITFNEIANPLSSSKMTYKTYFNLKKDYKDIQYYLYRSSTPIKSVKHLTPVARVKAFSGVNEYFYGKYTAKEFGNKPLIYYVIDPFQGPLGSGQGLFVFNPPARGSSYYAVTAAKGRKEFNTLYLGKNATLKPVEESNGKGIPILQRTKSPNEFDYIKNPKLFFYTRWETHPNTSVDGKPYDYLVAVPPKGTYPSAVGIHLHGWGGNLMGGYAWWNNASHGSILLSTNQDPYDWWTGYKEDYFTLKTQSPVIRPYTTNRIFSFLSFMAEHPQWDIDLSRTFTAGLSMGGSGAIMMAIRHPNRIAWVRSWVGVHVPRLSPQFRHSYENVWGKLNKNLKFEDGTPVWEYYDDVKYLFQHPKRDIGFISFSNGKNDGGIGWEQAVRFYEVLQKNRHPHLFIWGQAGHGQRTYMPQNGSERLMPIDITTTMSLPAFTHCSLDDNPGNGNPQDGNPSGQVNRWLYWETKDIKDTSWQWEMTMGLMKQAPAEECRVDVTPRRLQKFKPAPGTVIYWENRIHQGHTLVGKGRVKADKYGRVTLEGVLIGKSGNRISIRRRAETG